MTRETLRSLQIKRAAALTMPELKRAAPYVLTEHRLPEAGRACTVFADDGRGVYRLPFPVVRAGDNWINPKRQSVIAVKIIGWTYVTQET
jgi:hypothetical protein